nr:MAG TPA: hypothetical protein [Caudoviricetes sp.]
MINMPSRVFFRSTTTYTRNTNHVYYFSPPY